MESRLEKIFSVAINCMFSVSIARRSSGWGWEGGGGLVQVLAKLQVINCLVFHSLAYRDQKLTTFFIQSPFLVPSFLSWLLFYFIHLFIHSRVKVITQYCVAHDFPFINART